MSYVFYTYSGILKGVYRYTDSYACRAGDSRVGQEWCLLETAGVIEDIQLRGINTADSRDADAAKDISLSIGMLLLFYASNCLCLAAVVLLYKVNVPRPSDGSNEEVNHCQENELLESDRVVLDGMDNENDTDNGEDEDLEEQGTQ